MRNGRKTNDSELQVDDLATYEASFQSLQQPGIVKHEDRVSISKRNGPSVQGHQCDYFPNASGIKGIIDNQGKKKSRCRFSGTEFWPSWLIPWGSSN